MARITHFSGILTVLFLLLFFSCGFEDDPLPSLTAERTFGIRHDLPLSEYERIGNNEGAFSSSDYPDFSSVVAFTYSLNGSSNFEYVASGVLISPDWVLTAAHNFYVSDEQNSPASPSGIRVIYGPDPNDLSKEVTVDRLVFFPSWLEDDDIFGNANDFCLVKLKTPITSIRPAKLLSSPSEVVGSASWSAGYGDYSLLPGQDPDLYSLRHATSNTLDRVAGDIQSSSEAGTFTGGLLAVDFDSPAQDTNTLGDTYISIDEALLGGGSSSAVANPYEGSAVEGDSGGPLFLQVGDEWLVAGILSGAAEEPFVGHTPNSYGEIDIFIRVSLAYDWISSVTGL